MWSKGRRIEVTNERLAQIRADVALQRAHCTISPVGVWADREALLDLVDEITCLNEGLAERCLLQSELLAKMPK